MYVNVTMNLHCIWGNVCCKTVHASKYSSSPKMSSNEESESYTHMCTLVHPQTLTGLVFLCHVLQLWQGQCAFLQHTVDKSAEQVGWGLWSHLQIWQWNSQSLWMYSRLCTAMENWIIPGGYLHSWSKRGNGFGRVKQVLIWEYWKSSIILW